MNTRRWRRTLTDALARDAVIVGVGNVLRGDDGVGPLLVERLRSRTPLTCINAETSLDRYVGKIARLNPEVVIVIDAMHLDRRPGAREILELSSAIAVKWSTHQISPACMLAMLGESCHVLLLGIQPKCITLGAGPSGQVRRAMRIVERATVRAKGGRRRAGRRVTPRLWYRLAMRSRRMHDAATLVPASISGAAGKE